MNIGRDLALATPPDSVRQDESALLDASVRGDVEAFARVYSRYRAALYQACLAMLRNSTLAEDVVQDTFVRAFTGLPKFDASKRLWPWLVTIARRRCIDMLRRGERTSLMGDVEEADVPPSLGCDRSPDTTLEAVLGAEERARLRKALATLPARQRRVLLLHALEGWNYSDIASAEHSSVSSVKSLIFRARTNLKAVYQTGMLGIGYLPFRRFRQRVQWGASKAAARGEMAAAGIMPAATNLAAGALALALVMAGAPARSTDPADAVALQPAGIKAVALKSSSLSRGGAHAAKTEPAKPFGVSDAGRVLREQVVEPGEDATPEDTLFTDFAVSPSYATDRTIFASGAVPCLRPPCYVLFVSRDAGASFQRLPAAMFHGGSIALPPNYPADPRIFAMGTAGLEVSNDGGRTFEMASPLVGGIAISPAWTSNDQRILIGTTPAVVEYWADRDLMKPAPLPIATRRDSSVAFSPNYASDGLIFAGTIAATATSTRTSAVSRCVWSYCSNVELSSLGTPTLRLSPGFASDGVMFAFTADSIHMSRDSGASFVRVSIPEDVKGKITDVRFAGSRILVSVRGPSPLAAGLLAFDPHVQRWNSLNGASDRFVEGISQMVVMPDGRWIVAGSRTGFACTTNAGRTWAGRCAAVASS